MNTNYIGHPNQISGVEEYRLVGGKGDGMRFFHIRNGLGLDFSVSADRCADIAGLSFQGQNMNYMSPCGYVAPSYFERRGFDFLNSFTCGFLTTCGFNNIGSPNVDKEESLGLHGTLSNTPADHIYTTEDDEYIYLHATIRDAKIFNQKLILTRTITVCKTENKMFLHDSVKNEGSRIEPIMLLYHMNMGYPLLDEHTELAISSTHVKPRDEIAAQHLNSWNQMELPQPNFQEQCFYHTFDKELACAKVFNPTISKGLAISFETRALDIMTQWKMMGEKDYVLGLEPSNHYLDGRSVIKERNELKTIAPGETQEFNITIDFFDSKETWNMK
ncbi:MAG: aldose 1-epimerase family protein [Lachnospiraceae bacterium]